MGDNQSDRGGGGWREGCEKGTHVVAKGFVAQDKKPPMFATNYGTRLMPSLIGPAGQERHAFHTPLADYEVTTAQTRKKQQGRIQ